MIKKYLTMTILVTLVTPVLVQANDDSDTRWYVAPYGSYTKFDANPSDGWGGGLGLGKMLNENFNVELKGFYNNFGSTPEDTGLVGATADVQYFFFRDKYSPYAVIGAGGANAFVSNDELAGFVGEAGLGATYEICDGFFLRSDVRYRAFYTGGDRDVVNGVVINAGVVIPLGEKAEKPQPKIELPVAVSPTPVADCSTRDDDHDGINNCLDQCPGTIVGAKVDTQGCPISLDIKGVQFKFDSAELTSNAKIILDGVAASLIAYPQKNDLDVQGHTSSEGTDQYNKHLSQKRSLSVAVYLKLKGVSNKLTAHGYGENHPITENTTEEGRSRNRRVELIWLGN